MGLECCVESVSMGGPWSNLGFRFRFKYRFRGSNVDSDARCRLLCPNELVRLKQVTYRAVEGPSQTSQLLLEWLLTYHLAIYVLKPGFPLHKTSELLGYDILNNLVDSPCTTLLRGFLSRILIGKA